jgi:hypothetical protein
MIISNKFQVGVQGHCLDRSKYDYTLRVHYTMHECMDAVKKSVPGRSVSAHCT